MSFMDNEAKSDERTWTDVLDIPVILQLLVDYCGVNVRSLQNEPFSERYPDAVRSIVKARHRV